MSDLKTDCVQETPEYTVQFNHGKSFLARCQQCDHEQLCSTVQEAYHWAHGHLILWETRHRIIVDEVSVITKRE